MTTSTDDMATVADHPNGGERSDESLNLDGVQENIVGFENDDQTFLFLRLIFVQSE